ncbi:MAG: DUF354 domain-containing protein [Brumimicrobium sp.]|nr:DUF354 domain-containing protein [Brumimicrobium sp.]
MKKKKILFYFGHPAQYLFLRNTILTLQKNNDLIILIKTKDVLEDLIKKDGIPYKNILKKRRRNSRFSIFLSLIIRIFKIGGITLIQKPSMLISQDASTAFVGKILFKKTICITEDDFEVLKPLSNITYPVVDTILCPVVCNVGKYDFKKVGYEGYMKLGHLHPEVFRPDKTILTKYKLPEKYALIRLSQLNAYHDKNIEGLNNEILKEIIETIEQKGINVLISSENLMINEGFENFMLKIHPADMHHILCFAQLLISDSQSMSVEASILGVPSIRYSSFVGRISVLEELEHKYKLTFGVQIDEKNKIFELLDIILNEESSPDLYLTRRNKMLEEKINVTAFLNWFLELYPESNAIMLKNPDYQLRFISQSE